MKRSAYCFLLLLVAEVVASAAVWHGTPTDWAGGHLRFWMFEGLRLRYWGGFCLLFAALWGVGLHRLSSSPLKRNLLGLVCSLGVEVLASIFFWKGLSSSQVGYLGWLDLRQYAAEHLISWIVVLSIGLAVWHLGNKRKRPQSNNIENARRAQ